MSRMPAKTSSIRILSGNGCIFLALEVHISVPWCGGWVRKAPGRFDANIRFRFRFEWKAISWHFGGKFGDIYAIVREELKGLLPGLSCIQKDPRHCTSYWQVNLKRNASLVHSLNFSLHVDLHFTLVLREVGVIYNLALALKWHD